ncbi:class I SAM-dependent methyltransferase, partial [Coprobacillus cateniformis]|nr:class I SAM-dependent methyltransferase [Coprobacillus cateniformis]
MIKYDVPLNLEQNDNMKELVKNIKPNSVVLEFGPSTGRLTRYIKEELKCDIYIVEIDPEAFEISRQYANDGICDDIETYSWKVMASHKVFDYVIFADVLEHLKNPEK